MRPEDLRIGNFVSGVDYFSDEEARHNLIVLAIDTTGTRDYTYMFQCFDSKKESEFYIDIEPVPLTEQWLLKFGYEKTIHNHLHGDTGVFDERWWYKKRAAITFSEPTRARRVLFGSSLLP